MNHTPSQRTALGLVLLILVAAGLAGCTFDDKGLPLGYIIQADGQIVRYARVNPAAAPDAAQVSYSQSHAAPMWTGLRTSAPLYVDKGWVMKTPPPNPLKGSHLLRLAHTDRTNTAANIGSDWFVSIGLSGYWIDRFWIAFDDRATSPPTWLTDEFEPVPGPLYIDSSQIDTSGSTPRRVRYRLWRPTQGFPGYVQQAWPTLGGNNAAGVAWTNRTVGSQYLIIVRVQPRPDTATKKAVLDKVTLQSYTSCEKCSIAPVNVQRARQEALYDWLDKPKNTKHRPAFHAGFLGVENGAWVKVERITSSTSSSLRAPISETDDPLTRGWPLSSHGEVDPNLSSATVEVVGEGNPQSTPLAGTVDFATRADTTAVVETIELWGDDVTLSNGLKVTRLSMTVLEPVGADCDDGLPHLPGRLCTRYAVPTTALRGGVAFDVDGHSMSVELANDRRVILDVDPNTMRFTFSGGPLTGTLTINDHDYDVRVSLAVSGAFTELAPVADVSESRLVAECGDQGTGTVGLSATASVDELHPGSVVGYEWFQDYGSLDHRSVGTGANVSVTLPFGSHDMTLKVTDAAGTFSTTDFIAEVVDSKIDTVQPPTDRWVTVADPAGTWVDIGTAYASDICSGSVDIGNDAPASSTFSPGYTPVTWTFDDFRGNVVRHTQRIFVVDPAFYPPPVSELSVSPDEVLPGATTSITHQTWPQGRGMLLDEYILIRGGERSVWSVNRWGEIVPGLEPHATSLNVGAAPTSSTVFSGDIAPHLNGPGAYTVQSILVAPNGDPADPTEILAFADVGLWIVES